MHVEEREFTQGIYHLISFDRDYLRMAPKISANFFFS